ncbi:MAG: cytidylate kinase-like family protein [Clostridiales bacterium]|nr:cytidylate kinase-like family protein [Clostridiales bacterium]
MAKTYPIITITRQYGSWGRIVARELGKALGIPFYDDELLEMAAKESHIDPKLFERAEHTNAANSFIYAINRLGAGSTYNVPVSDQLFSAISSVIRSIADTRPAVIVGRCADYILRDYTRTVDIFVQAESEVRAHRIMDLLKLNEQNAFNYIKKMDRSQASYYNFYSDMKWDRLDHYDLVINTTHLEMEQITRILQLYVQEVLGDELTDAIAETLAKERAKEQAGVQ